VSLAVGVDVGATKIAAARVDVARGEILAARRIATAAQRGPGAVLADCRALAAELRDGAAAVGIAVCELVDPSGRVCSAETIDWRDVDLLAAPPADPQAAGSHPFDWVESDVRAAALAEARFGAGRGEPDLLYVSVGSGISHCLMTAGEPRLGVRGSAIGTGAPLVERWSGGLALARRTGHASAQEALADPAAADIVGDAAQRLGLALAALVNALDPGAVIIGGGLGLHDGYRARVEAALRAEVYDPRARELPVLPAGLGPDAPVIGAALAAAARVR
jgi:predicted NBD/HSP70 family sugar kinase